MNIPKLAGIALTIAGCAVSLAQGALSKKEQDAKIEKAAEKAVAKILESKESK